MGLSTHSSMYGRNCGPLSRERTVPIVSATKSFTARAELTSTRLTSTSSDGLVFSSLILKSAENAESPVSKTSESWVESVRDSQELGVDQDMQSTQRNSKIRLARLPNVRGMPPFRQ